VGKNRSQTIYFTMKSCEVHIKGLTIETRKKTNEITRATNELTSQ
jgi:hypothetical protein